MSGLTHKYSGSKDILKKNSIIAAKRLLGSAIMVLAIRTTIRFMRKPEIFMLSNNFGAIESLIWASVLA